MLFASATSIVPGRASRYRGLAVDLEPHLAAYEALNAEYGVAPHSYWISHARDGTDIGVSVYHLSPEGLAAMKEGERDSGLPTTSGGWSSSVM